MSKKILLVEDEKYIRDLYRHLLNTKGYEISECDNGEDALAMMTSDNFDLILLDILLPKMHGLDILQRLKDAGHTDTISKTIMLTNLDEEVTVYRAQSYGVRGYLIKSQNPPEKLLQEIEQFLV